MANQYFVIVDQEDSDKFRQLEYNTYESLLQKLGFHNNRFWAFADKDKDNFEKIQVGDLIFFTNKGDSSFSFCAKVSGKEDMSDLPQKVFGDDFRTKITKSVIFFNEFFKSLIIYHEMLRSTGRKIQNNPRIYLIENKFEKIKNDDLNISEFEESKLIPIDLAGPPPKIRFEITRFIRDTKKTHELKNIYENKCQTCHYQIIKPNNEYYSEVHHIWSLGKKPIGGDDNFENMIVLCPTHHAEFDYNVIKISKNGENIIDKDGTTISKLFFRGGHKIAEKNINQQF